MSTAELTPTTEQIETLRDLFFKKLEKESPPCDGSFHPKDVSRIKTSNKWLQLFLEQMDLDMKQALKMLWDTCVWRKTFGTNDISEINIRIDYMEHGAMFVHNKDINDKYLLILKSKLHQKGTQDVNDLIRLLVYWIERIQRETNYDQITLFFDMSGAGLSNMDMDFTKRIIDTFKLYYPNSLNFIIIYDMPWILSAAFKIIKGLLPPKAVAKMKFLNSKSIKDCVTEDNSLKCWGGKDDYEFKFIPDQANNNDNNIQNNNIPDSNHKKVHFANISDQDSPNSEMSGLTTLASGSDGEMLLIKPEDAIIFSKNENEYSGSVEITNINSKCVTYKIKTTSPEKFRVKPSSGVLPPNSSVEVTVVLQHGHVLSAMSKDKFLVMCMSLPSEININSHSIQLIITELWKNTCPSSLNIEQHRLRCSLPNIALSATGDGFKNGRLPASNADENTSSLNVAVCQLFEQNEKLNKELKSTQRLQWITIGLFFFISILSFFLMRNEIVGIYHCQQIQRQVHSEL